MVTTGGTLAAPPVIVPTDPLPPDQQQRAFELPPGFEIELIASEPDIGQPMNLNFDAAGRLWVTNSIEYPYPVSGEGVEERDERFGPNGDPPTRDKISNISGIGTDDLKVTHFAEGLNIPIGIVPLSTNSAIGYSIPNLIHWSASGGRQSPDSGGSLSADAPTEHAASVLYGPFGNVDTHGMVNGLTHWIDGWIYACHGFRNTSTIQGTDGHEITMNSGNTFRFRPDGSHVEQFTWGQVNPYGLTFDPWGNAYTADCHSKPLTCLIPGAYYTSFGKPHDGLGFGPDMIDHSHGSTGICGPCYYAADHFPPEYRDCLYLCNPVTGIVHRDRLIWQGSSPQVDTQPDFITCEDGWFRPVDIQLGPDGALYIADFYNAIIGHYEAPLDHPRRDRTHGRIWRVTYTGDKSHERSTGFQPVRERGITPEPETDTAADTTVNAAHGVETRAAVMPDLTRESLNQLIDRLADPNLTVRVLASHLIADEHGGEATELLRTACREAQSDEQQIHVLWLLTRLGLDVDEELAVLGSAESPLVRTHVARVLGNKPTWDHMDSEAVTTFLVDEDARVRRAAAEAWSRHPSEEIVETLVRQLPPPNTKDTHLRHAMRIALRNCLMQPGVLATRTKAETISPEIASVCLGIASAESATYLLLSLRKFPESASRLDWTTHIARQGVEEDVRALISLAHGRTDQNVMEQMAVLRALDAGHSPSESRLPELIHWARDLARQLLEQVPQQPDSWLSRPLPAQQQPAVDWGTELRTAADEQPTRLWSSRPGGEQGIGVLRSPSFTAPEELNFWIAGHDGFPDTDAAGKNVVRLVRDADGHVLRSVAVPRQDPPVLVTWTLMDEIGQDVHVELVDGLDLRAFAWIAAGRFSVEALNPPEFTPSELAAELIGTWLLRDLRPDLERLISASEPSTLAVQDLARAHLQLEPDIRLEALLPLLRTSPQSPLAQRIKDQLVRRDPDAIDELLSGAMRSASGGRQQAIATVLAGQLTGVRQLVRLVRAGHASARLLQSAAIQQMLTATGNQQLHDQVAELVSDLPPENERLAELIAKRRSSFERESASVEQGREIFKKICAVCHQIGDEGKKVGPQLDGVGIRGVDRLLEDILDPHRNVDAAFRSTTLLTTDGRVLTGLLRREEGDTLVLADSKGEEFRVASDDIEQRSLSPLSLMPADVAEKLSPSDLHNLLAFLLSQTEKQPD